MWKVLILIHVAELEARRGPSEHSTIYIYFAGSDLGVCAGDQVQFPCS